MPPTSTSRRARRRSCACAAGCRAIEDFEPFGPEETRDLLYRVLSTEQQKQLEIDRQIDFSYSVPGVARFRVNVYFQRDSLAAPSASCPR